MPLRYGRAHSRVAKRSRDVFNKKPSETSRKVRKTKNLRQEEGRLQMCNLMLWTWQVEFAWKETISLVRIIWAQVMTNGEDRMIYMRRFHAHTSRHPGEEPVCSKGKLVTELSFRSLWQRASVCKHTGNEKKEYQMPGSRPTKLHSRKLK